MASFHLSTVFLSHHSGVFPILGVISESFLHTSPVSDYESLRDSLSPTHMDTSCLYLYISHFSCPDECEGFSYPPLKLTHSDVGVPFHLSRLHRNAQLYRLNFCFCLALLSFLSGAPTELLQKMPSFMLPR